MADTENGAASTEAAGTGDQAQQTAPRMRVVTQFIRDLSFENVLAQRGTGGDVNPDVQVAVNLDAKKRSADNHYEVMTKLTITSSDKGTNTKLFVVELEYVGVFQIENVPDDQMHPYLLIECPRMLFPFVRRIVSDVTRDGGFPALNLETIDFVQLYRNELLRRQQAEAGQTAGNADA